MSLADRGSLQLGRTQDALLQEEQQGDFGECLSDDILGQLVEGVLPPTEAAHVDRHLRGCAICRELLADCQAATFPPKELDEYRLLRPLGQGAMGQVYLGHDTLLDRRVAIKFVSSAGTDPTLQVRLLTEARAIARLQHPNVVGIYRVGMKGGRPYLVSEYVEGQSLDQIPKPLPWREVLPLALGLSRGLAAAHLRGVLHRDIKPANAMRTVEGEAKLLDFGLAKLTTESQPAMVTPGSPKEEAPEVTQDGAIVGSPLYMAPEIFRGELATPRSDVYSLGVLLYELCTGAAPYRGKSLWQLQIAVQAGGAPALDAVVPGIDGALAAVVDRCLQLEPSARFASAEDLSLALLEIGVGSAPLPGGNPYRGLHAFSAEHRALFCGRDAEVEAVLELLREEPHVLVTGDSGVGKSSLCRAGVLPRVLEGALPSAKAWTLGTLVPGREPLSALASVLAAVLGVPEEVLLQEWHADPQTLAQRLRRRGSEAPGLLLFIDQLEELLTQGAAEAERFCAVLAPLLLRNPGLRLLLTVRGDFLLRLVALPELGRALARVLYILGPMQRGSLREAILRPARTRGFSFESDAMVEELVSATAQTGGGLPLLQFTLAELWEARDAAKQLIPASALVALGGVGGALSRHAEGVLTRLLPTERAAVQHILLRLVSAEGTRVRRRENELVKDRTERGALDALVQGRLLVAHRVEEAEDPQGAEYEVAHEALVHGWARLREWLDQSTELRALHQRLRFSATEWQRLQKGHDALWGSQHLREAQTLHLAEDNLSPIEAAFLRASFAKARSRLFGRIALVLGVPLLLGIVYGALTLERRYQVERQVLGELTEARRALAEAQKRNAAASALRKEAFAAFDDGRIGPGEGLFARALAEAGDGAGSYQQAERALERALLRDPRHLEGLRLFAELLYEQVLAAEERGDPGENARLRLANYDLDGSVQNRLHTKAKLYLRTEPAQAQVMVERYEDRAGHRHLVVLPGGPAPIDLQLPPGSYRLTLRAPGRALVRYPVLLGRAESVHLQVTLPDAALVPSGFVYIPPGYFLYGSADDEGLRRDLLAQPQHRVHTGAFLISRTEVTFAEWIRFLESLSEEERVRRTPRVDNLRGTLRLEQQGGGYTLVIKPTDRIYRAGYSEPLRYPERDHRAEQDWRRFPVSGISFEDAQAYVAFLRSGGQVKGARLCNEWEWERAARGADDRRYPFGDQPAPDDANFDATYGRRKLGFGPDEVGTHPASHSPFDVADLMGNVWEWVRSVAPPEEIVYRGGAWYFSARTGRSANRQPGEPALRDMMIGLRVCADLP